MTGKAIEKLKSGEKDFKGDMKANFMKHSVCEALISFCKQNAEFARAVAESDKTFDGAMKEVVKAVKRNAISDIEAYRAAVSYFFPGAVVDFVMQIRMSEYEDPAPITEAVKTESEQKPKQKKAKILTIDLDDLL